MDRRGRLLAATSGCLPDGSELEASGDVHLRFHPAVSSERAQMCRRGVHVPRQSTDHVWRRYRRGRPAGSPPPTTDGGGGAHCFLALFRKFLGKPTLSAQAVVPHGPPPC